MDIAQEMLTTFSDDSDLLKKVITGDKSWVYGYDIETKAQSSRVCYDWGVERKIETGVVGDVKIGLEKKKRWHKCLISEGGYFEGNNKVIDK